MMMQMVLVKLFLKLVFLLILFLPEQQFLQDLSCDGRVHILGGTERSQPLGSPKHPEQPLLGDELGPLSIGKRSTESSGTEVGEREDLDVLPRK